MKRRTLSLLTNLVIFLVFTFLGSYSVEAQTFKGVKIFPLSHKGEDFAAEENRFSCGTVTTFEGVQTSEKDFTRRQEETFAFGTQGFNPTVIDVYFHVISKGVGVENGDVPEEQIVNQVKLLNEVFNPMGVSFNLLPVNRVRNETWFNSCDNRRVAPQMKAALREGTLDDLNIYTCNLNGGTLGISTFPWEASSNPSLDGVTLLYTTLPGGSAANFNEGDSLIHEIGHWMGLYHTYEGGCTNRGDMVTDTPAQKYPTAGCQYGLDTCTGPRFPGTDAVENFMNSSYDSCRMEFTAGQKERMAAQFATYRAGK